MPFDKDGDNYLDYDQSEEVLWYYDEDEEYSELVWGFFEYAVHEEGATRDEWIQGATDYYMHVQEVQNQTEQEKSDAAKLADAEQMAYDLIADADKDGDGRMGV